jgi:MtN3 and saliva related transmembrane protein
MLPGLLAELIGYAAATLGTFVMLPQVVKTIRSRSAHDVSGVMLGIYLVQNVLWFAYGLMIWAVPLIACNVVAFVLCSFQAFLKRRYDLENIRRQPQEVVR